MYVDPHNRSTWKNYPAPPVPDWFQKKLVELGGRRLTGEPILRVVWGQERKWFFAGEERLYYVDRRIPPTQTVRYKRERCSRDESGDVIKVNGELLFEKKYYESMGAAFADSEYGGFATEEPHLEWVGQSAWFIEQWTPPHLIQDTPMNWETHRYGEWQDPATGVIHTHLDLLGPFPYDGRYELIMAIGEATGEVTSAGFPVMVYRPLGEDVLDDIRRALWGREHAVEENIHAIAAREDDARFAKEQKEQDELLYAFKSELKPIAHMLTDQIPHVSTVDVPAIKEGAIRKNRFGKAKVVKII